MQQEYAWGDGVPWGRGFVAVCMMAYWRGDLEASPQLRAYHSHHYYLAVVDNAERQTREGVALYHTDQEATFCIIGWTRPIFRIEQPTVNRSN